MQTFIFKRVTHPISKSFSSTNKEERHKTAATLRMLQ